jgi:hypothetical protein
MSEFLNNRYFFNEISPSYLLIPEFLTTFAKENVLILPEFLKNQNFLMENLLVLPEFLKNQYFVKGKSPKISEF